MAAHDNQRFYEQFQITTGELEKQIEQLPPRQETVDEIRGAITRLSKSLADASDALPSYDQKVYTQSIKGLTEKLDRRADTVIPRPKFQFKSRSKYAGPDPRRLDRGPAQDAPSEAGKSSTKDTAGAGKAEVKDYNAEIKRVATTIRRPSFSSAKMVQISSHKGLNIVLPSSAFSATSSGSLQDLEGCYVDMSIAARQKPFAGLALKNIHRCIIVTGKVAGPVHVTGVTESFLLIASRQVRMHECKGVDTYLHCTSHPIIEDCTGMRFAPIPEPYTPTWVAAAQNQWDQVDDFKWLKADHSPNWKILSEEDRLPNNIWPKEEPDVSEEGIHRLFKATGIIR